MNQLPQLGFFFAKPREIFIHGLQHENCNVQSTSEFLGFLGLDVSESPGQ